MYFKICPEYCFYFISLKGKSVQELPLHLGFPARRKGKWKKPINFFMYKPAKGKMSKNHRIIVGKCGKTWCYPSFILIN